MTVIFHSGIPGFSFLIDLKMDKYRVEIFCFLLKRRSNLADKTATFHTHSGKRIDIIVTPDRILTLIMSFPMSDATDIVVLNSKAMMF
jgi:hypothetical protein